MIFESLVQKATTRFHETHVFLRQVAILESTSSNHSVDMQALNTMKGLFFVQLYGSFEVTVTDCLTSVLKNVLSLEPPNCDLQHSFKVISMHSAWQGIRDVNEKGILMKMAKVFSNIDSPGHFKFSETLFAHSLQNIHPNTIDDIVAVMGIRKFPPSGSEYKFFLSELVDKRNAVAHGRESAAFVGARYSCADLENKHKKVKEFALLFIDAISDFFENRDFVKESERDKYRPLNNPEKSC